jgi:uncharacterized protein (TIGR03790 family)
MLAGLLWLSTAWNCPAAEPRPAIGSAELGLVINTSDPQSVATGEYYARRRGIPPGNVVRVRFTPADALTPLAFADLRRAVEAALPSTVQALALAWTRPWRVGCLSITGAFALGTEFSLCEDTCKRTPYSPYFNWEGNDPYTKLGLRPTMMLAASSPHAARALIDRGIAADGSRPRGTAYLLSTSDDARNVRAPSFSSARLFAGPDLAVELRDGNILLFRRDVMFYFTGLPYVPGIWTNRFLPGAISDHLTSTGGVLVGGNQMSALRWLDAGATASYGTVVEPCNHPGKFPSVPILLRHYLAGESLIEAYWKSVAMPAQGVFVGEPLAAPYAGPRLQ